MAGLAAGGFHLLRLAMSDYVLFERGSLAYLVLVDRHIANFPTPGRGLSPLRYDHAAQDGMSPRRIGVSFSSELPPPTLAARYRAICPGEGYRVEADRRDGIVCVRPGEVLRIALQPSGRGSRVRLAFEQDLS